LSARSKRSFCNKDLFGSFHRLENSRKNHSLRALYVKAQLKVSDLIHINPLYILCTKVNKTFSDEFIDHRVRKEKELHFELFTFGSDKEDYFQSFSMP
jgi:hypothetical protein